MQSHTARRRRLPLLAILTGLLALSPSATLLADDVAPAKPADAKPAAAGRDKEAIVTELQALSKSIDEVITSREVFSDDALRAKTAPKAVPLMRKFLAAYEEFAGTDELAKAQLPRIRSQYLAMMVSLGDADAEAQLKKLAAGQGPDAIEAQGSLLYTRWTAARGDAEKQKALIDDVRKLVKANPTNESILLRVMDLGGTDVANVDLMKSLKSILSDEGQGPAAKELAEVLQAQIDLKSMEGKPLILTGVDVEGHPFSTEAWKGKVVLVDFWATWCPPCRAALPKLKQIYADYHSGGLEVVGVSSDERASALQKFLKEDPQMPWPQLFDESAAKAGEWHSLTKTYGVRRLPTMFLIDRKGIVRSVDAANDFDIAVPKIMQEK